MRALVLAVAVLATACVPRAPAPLPPVFPLDGALRSAEPGAPILFPVSKGVRLRAASRLEPATPRAAFVAWDAKAKALLVFDAKGRERASWPLDAAAAWVSGDRLLARSELFEPGRGFSFALFSIDGRAAPKELWRGNIDCFPSSVAFSPSGAAYLAGGDGADEFLAVYALSSGSEPKRLLHEPKRADFLRIVLSGDRLVAFESPRDKAARPLVMRVIDISGTGAPPEDWPIAGAPEGALCLFGFGFAFEDDIVVPAAMADGGLSLMRLEGRDVGFAVKSVAAGAIGSYAPLGPGPDGAYGYLAYDYERDPDSYFLGRYDGSSARLEPIGTRANR